MNSTETLTSELSSPRQQGANPEKPYFPALDGLRAVAVILVFFAHYAALHIGWMGVNIFFVLSGFLITGILYDSRAKVHRFRDFYARRTLRIFPLYYAVWLGLLLLTPFLHIAWRPLNLLWPLYLGNWIPLIVTLHPAAGNVFHVVAYPLAAKYGASAPPLVFYTGHFWSLCIEEQFYLIWPLVVFLVGRRETLFRICVATALLSPLLRIAAMHFLPPAYTQNGVLHNCTFLRFDEFLIGGLGALGLRGNGRQRLQAAANLLFGAGVLCIASSYLVGRFVFHMATDIVIQMHWILAYGITFVDIAGLGMILLCVQPGSWLSRLMNIRALRAVGRISYGFYVFHDIPHALYGDLNYRLHLERHGLHLILPFTATLLLALLSYHLLESPFLGLKTRFEGGGTARPVSLQSPLQS